jgi:hypothetical protein
VLFLHEENIFMSAKTSISISELAKSVKSDSEALSNIENEINTASVLTKADTSAVTKEEVETVLNKASEKQKAAATEAQKFVARVETKTVKTKAERAYDIVAEQLDVYKNATIGSADKVDALVKIVDAVTKAAKKSMLDLIYKFFSTNKDADFLQEANALQGIERVAKTNNIKIRVFYGALRALTLTPVSKDGLNLDVIRQIFRSDDFTNWCAVKLTELTRGR